MDEIRLVNAIPLEKEMLEYAQYIGRETTNECESAAESCADMVSGAPTIDPESLPPHWRKSEEAPPKKKDGDALGSVFAVAYHRNIRNGIWLANVMPWHIVADCPEMYPLWMPLPKLPDLPAPERRCMIGND